MKPITVTETVYTLDELSDTARRNALEKMCTWMNEWIEPDQVTEYLNGELFTILTGECVGEIGNDDLNRRVGLIVEWSLNYCQGDGVAIYGTLNSDDAPNVKWHGASNATFTRNSHGHHYSHENCMTVELFSYGENGHQLDADKETTEKFAEQFRDVCRELARLGYDQIENLTDEQAIREHLEWTQPRRFTEDGDIYPTKWWGE